MPNPDQEKQLIMVSLGVVLFSIVAIIVFIIGASQILFYLFALIAIGLGFYLSYTLSQEGKQKDQPNRSKK